jgi:protein-disulfide isomerase
MMATRVLLRSVQKTLRNLGLITGMLPAALLPVLPGTNNDMAGFWLGGQPNAPVKIEVFSDYQCPHCRSFYLETIKPLIEKLTIEKKIDDIYIVYHDLPLDMHPYARKAASYALAASRLGREPWLRVVDCLYQQQSVWAQNGNIEAVISGVLGEAEMTHVRKLAADPMIEQTLRDEIALAQSRQIRATPTFIISTQAGRQERVSGMVPYEILKGHLDNVLR